MIILREEVAHAIEGTRVEAARVRCPRCKMTDFHASTTYQTRRGDATVYLCDNVSCRHRFTWRPGFKKRWFSDDTITDALVDAAAGHPPARICERMGKNGIVASERTLRRWVDAYAELIEKFASTLEYAVGGRWSIDEKHLRTHPDGTGKRHWLVAVME